MAGIFLLLLLAVTLSHAQPAVLGVTNGASHSGNLAPGTAAIISGTQLASVAAVAQSVPLPTQISGVTVTVGGVAAPLRFISPGQINLVIPLELAVPPPGSPVPVRVTNSAGQSAPFNILLSRDSPGLFTQDSSATGNVWAFDANYNAIAAVGTDMITLYAAGLGPTNSAAASAIEDNVSVFVGDNKADIFSAGLAPGYPDLYQLKVVPHGAATDRVYLKVNGWQSNIARVPLAPGSNVVNVTGSIDGLYPATVNSFGTTPIAGPIAFSVMLIAATFTIDFDILPNAKPLSVVATSEGGTAMYNIDPVLGTWQGTLTVPTAQEKSYDFRGSEFSTILDFTTCLPSGACSPFPVDVIPPTVRDPIAVKAAGLLPLPNGTDPGSINLVSASGALSGGHFSMGPVQFGGFIQIPHAGPSNRTTSFRLYVDGTLIASKDVMYPVL